MSLVHPQVINGRQVWLDTGMDALIDKIQNGDSVLGWEGDDRLAVYAHQTQHGVVFELWRLDEDNQYRRVVATEPGDPFDNHIIHWLVMNDKRRKPDNWSVADDIDAHNAAIQAAKEAQRAEWVQEEAAPRLLHAIRKDG